MCPHKAGVVRSSICAMESEVQMLVTGFEQWELLVGFQRACKTIKPLLLGVERFGLISLIT